MNSKNLLHSDHAQEANSDNDGPVPVSDDSVALRILAASPKKIANETHMKRHYANVTSPEFVDAKMKTFQAYNGRIQCRQAFYQWCNQVFYRCNQAFYQCNQAFYQWCRQAFNKCDTIVWCPLQ